MVPKSYKVSVPGSLMVLGEHAVLFHSQAIVCAVAKRIQVELYQIETKHLQIQSNTLGNFKQELDSLSPEKPFEYVIAAVLQFINDINYGICLKIKAEFSDKIGYGSSAAVTVAVLAVVSTWLGYQFSKQELWRLAKTVVHKVANRGSGSDIAASIYGGLIAINTDTFKVINFDKNPPLSVMYSGYKTTTKEVLTKVQADSENFPEAYQSLYKTMDSCVTAGIKYIEQQNWHKLGRIFNMYHNLLSALGVSDPKLNRLYRELNQSKQILGAKISGSGLGDCVIGLGDYTGYGVDIDQQGLIYE